MELTRNGNAFDILCYRKDHTPLSTTAYLQDNQLIVQRVGSWNKVFPMVDQKGTDEGIRFETLGEDASVLTINSFLIDKKALIDSLIQVNDDLISHRKYLIIDLRNNGGGHIMSVNSILPYLYTKPILMDGLEVKSSVENIQIYKEVRNTKGFSADDREAFDSIIYKLEQNPNKIVRVAKGDVFTLDSIKPNPSIVAIVTNETTASAAELFILWARQSAKIILFGRRTSGALDYTEIGRIRTLPCSVFSFICPMGAGDHSHDPYIDNIGIEPDVYLNYGTSGWIKSVYDYLKSTH
jgi:C-terminal processing protease CtpA/Prc